MPEDNKEGVEVFRQEVATKDGKKHGKVGFDRDDGKDFIRVVSWNGGRLVAADFSLDAAEEVAHLILHALKTKSRPDSKSCYGFKEKT